MALLAILLQLAAPALLLPHLHAFHQDAAPATDGRATLATDRGCHHDQHAGTGQPPPRDHAHCVVCQLAMQVQHGGLSASLTVLPPIGTLPARGPAPILPAPDCTPSVRLPDICGPPIG